MTNYFKSIVLGLLLAATTALALGIEPESPQRSVRSPQEISRLSSYLDRVRHLMDDETLFRLAEDLYGDADQQTDNEVQEVDFDGSQTDDTSGHSRQEPSAPIFDPLDLTVTEFLYLPDSVLDPSDVATVNSASYVSQPLYVVISDHPAQLVATFVSSYQQAAPVDRKQVLLVNWGGVFESFFDPYGPADQNFSIHSSSFDLNSIATMNTFRMPDYRSLAKQVECAGDATYNMLKTFQSSSSGLLPDDVRIFCSGVGCQVAARVGEQFSGEIGSITAIAPAVERFTDVANTYTLDSGDTQFLTVIHTTGETYGITDLTGHVDIFLLTDPIPDDYFFCPYVLGLLAFDAFIQEREVQAAAYKCVTAEEFMSGDCSLTERLLLGYDIDTSASGAFYHELNMNVPNAQPSTRNRRPNPFSEVVKECTRGHDGHMQLPTAAQLVAVTASNRNPGVVEVFDASRFLTVHHPDVPRGRTVKVMINPSIDAAFPKYEAAVAASNYTLKFRFRNGQLKTGNFNIKKISITDFTNPTETAPKYEACDVLMHPWEVCDVVMILDNPDC